MHLLRNYVKAAMARRQLQPIWRSLHKLSIYGMGYRLPDASISGEDHVLALVRRELRNGSGTLHIVDGGARYGEFTEKFANDANLRVHVFEPNPASCAVLERRFGAVETVRINRVALSDAVGETDLYDVGTEGSPFSTTISARLEAFGKSIDTRVRVPTDTLDRYFEEIDGPVALLKLDIEGAEEAALRGARRLLESGRIDMMFLEHSHVSAISGFTIFRICGMLPHFDVYRVIPGSVVPIRTSERPYSAWDEVMAYCNLLLIRRNLPTTTEMRRYLRARSD